jgi:hypothetical protein
MGKIERRDKRQEIKEIGVEREERIEERKPKR